MVNFYQNQMVLFWIRLPLLVLVPVGLFKAICPLAVASHITFLDLAASAAVTALIKTKVLNLGIREFTFY